MKRPCTQPMLYLEINGNDDDSLSLYLSFIFSLYLSITISLFHFPSKTTFPNNLESQIPNLASIFFIQLTSLMVKNGSKVDYPSKNPGNAILYKKCYFLGKKSSKHKISDRQIVNSKAEIISFLYQMFKERERKRKEIGG